MNMQDEMWLMPMYTHVKEYIEGITKNLKDFTMF